jgi:hypothetical protein
MDTPIWELPWIENGLIDKLILAGAVQVDRNEILFTLSFSRFFLKRLDRNIGKVQTIEYYRRMLADFHSKLGNLSDGEIGATVALANYYFDHYKPPHPTGC